MDFGSASVASIQSSMATANVTSSQFAAVLANEADAVVAVDRANAAPSDADDDIKSERVLPSETECEAVLQAGVQGVQGVTSIWSPRALALAYALVWGLFFVLLMQMQSLATLSAFITSDFGFHSLTPTIAVVANVVAGVLLLPVSRLIDIFGRPHGLAYAAIVATLGMIIMAAAKNIETTAAAEVFLVVGQNALFYTIKWAALTCLGIYCSSYFHTSIFVADTSSLKSRALALAFASSPNLVVVWVVGYFNDAFINGPGWRWGFGTFAFINPFVTLPLFALILFYTRKAKKAGLVGKRQR